MKRGRCAPFSARAHCPTAYPVLDGPRRGSRSVGAQRGAAEERVGRSARPQGGRIATDWEAQILAAEERLRQAQLHNDVAALDELLAPDLLFTGHLGQIASKADDLAAHRARLLRLTEATVVERHLQLHPTFAVVSTLLHLVGSYDGQPIDQQMRYTRVWARTDAGVLQVVAGHMSQVPAE